MLWLKSRSMARRVAIAFFGGEVGKTCMGLILVTDYLWIPLFIYYQVRTGGNPSPAATLAGAP